MKSPPREVTEKAMTINYFPPTTHTKSPNMTNWRYTDLALKTNKIKGRLFDHIP